MLEVSSVVGIYVSVKRTPEYKSQRDTLLSGETTQLCYNGTAGAIKVKEGLLKLQEADLGGTPKHCLWNLQGHAAFPCAVLVYHSLLKHSRIHHETFKNFF
ncbi:hypothetical protein DP116_02340 [Brasilonema bromeliae SPC951]|uniref:Uncharacterized protein n=1 Tax=Brasilonema bromeliae SPC951 TaxID=385972 RepID=A0ABX1P458_9CYAN|nr:hypothetical protein [Brasilonema bromeliae SPC951]